MNVMLAIKDLEQYWKSVTYNGIEKDGKTLTQGGYSNRIIVDENSILRIPENLSLECTALFSVRV